VKYRTYETDEHNRVKQCIICSNEDIQGDYCQFCGTYLINKCTGFSPSYFDDKYTGPWHIHFEHSCGSYLDANARFCNSCGSKSVFYEAGILKSWEV
jgi:rRNA maturation endonuclease Nob1